MKKLVLFGEGDGEKRALPVITSRIISEMNAWHVVSLEPDAMIVGELPGLLKNNAAEWRRFLRIARKRKDFGGVLLLLDGDCPSRSLRGEKFCSKVFAGRLAKVAVDEGAGTSFSVAIVFACREFESWIIAGIESLAGRDLPNPATRVEAATTPPEGDLESNPRDAKGWLGKHMVNGYSAPRDQAVLAREVDLNLIRSKGMRSFARFESAIRQLITSFQHSVSIATPFVTE
ncbi:MAG: DUF4276 family protein [Pirellulaceae bacterium]